MKSEDRITRIGAGNRAFPYETGGLYRQEQNFSVFIIAKEILNLKSFAS